MASHKRLQFDDAELPATEGSKKFKNSLDSDEEDDEENENKYNLLNAEEVEGQEDKTIEYDGNIKITPFNMDDELEEGHFDKEGMFIFNKDTEQIRDNWLDNIDWVKVQHGKEKVEEDAENSNDSEAKEDVFAVYKQMLEIMSPGETVLRCIKRLGGGKRDSTINRWKKKKDEEPKSNNGVDDDGDKNKELLLKMTELADRIIATGDMDIYQQTFERLKYLTESKERKGEAADAEGCFDMFADDVDETKVVEETKKKDEDTKGNEEVLWEFKWENTDDAPIYGKHTSSEMLQWVRDGYFESGVWVRKAHETDAPFYSSRRIDFDLYV
ncbi:CD2 antigen cytoplasmic tail-binding protein 2 homolog isoform X2 [Ornithodoros turicata]